MNVEIANVIGNDQMYVDIVERWRNVESVEKKKNHVGNVKCWT